MRLIILAVLFYVLYRLIKGLWGTGKEIDRSGEVGVIDEMVQDPFCKTYIPRRESVKRVINEETHYFCSEECATKFEKGESPWTA